MGYETYMMSRSGLFIRDLPPWPPIPKFQPPPELTDQEYRLEMMHKNYMELQKLSTPTPKFPIWMIPLMIN